MLIRAELLDQFGAGGERLGAELARFALQRVRRDHQPDGVLLAHRGFDRGDALGAVLAEIAEDADEARAKFAAALLEMHPIDNVVAVVHASLPSGPVPALSTTPPSRAKGKEGVYSSLLSYGFLVARIVSRSGTGPNCRSRRIELSR